MTKPDTGGRGEGRSSDLVMVEREVREKIAHYRDMGGKVIYSGEHVANMLEHWIDRLSALQSVEGGVQLAAKQESCPESATRTETAYWKSVAKELSDVLLTVRPLGGSELFKRFKDETYLADPAYFKAAIGKLRQDLLEANLTAAKLTKTPSADHDAGNLRSLAEPNHHQPHAVSQGWQLVPIEPTVVQSNAGVAADDMRTGYETIKHIYRAMVAAAPPSPAKTGGAE